MIEFDAKQIVRRAGEVFVSKSATDSTTGDPLLGATIQILPRSYIEQVRSLSQREHIDGPTPNLAGMLFDLGRSVGHDAVRARAFIPKEAAFVEQIVQTDLKTMELLLSDYLICYFEGLRQSGVVGLESMTLDAHPNAQRRALRSLELRAVLRLNRRLDRELLGGPYDKVPHLFELSLSRSGPSRVSLADYLCRGLLAGTVECWFRQSAAHSLLLELLREHTGTTDAIDRDLFQSLSVTSHHDHRNELVSVALVYTAPSGTVID